MRLLALESATATPSVALVDGGRVVAERPAGADATRSETILPAVSGLLEDCGVGLGDLDGFAIAIGPGSFTGLRVGLATLKGLAFEDARPVAAVSSLAALARRAGEPRPGPVAALLDARRGELYAAVWAAGADAAPRLPEGLYRPGEILAALPPDCRLSGDGADLLRAAAGEGAPWEVLPPMACAGFVGLLGARALAAGGGVPAAGLVPRYLRRAEAEVRRTGEALEPL